MEVENRENLKKHKAFVLVANHQSSTDYIGKYILYTLSRLVTIALK